ncbi:leucine-rich repeat domain-containing protein, partial [Thioalkalivibrio sp. ALE20]|uniref:leucine-rich repeat domain-containing protein n=1 Tax=Thioalkalivibrio sp. ALE20 TaxID=545275 RepID=UPI0018DBD1CF
MSEKEKFPLVPASSTSVARLDEGSSTVLSRMSDDVLAAARDQEHAREQARFRAGGYEFREADYRQINSWAVDLGLTPDAVVKILAATHWNWTFGRHLDDIEFTVVDGRITELVIDFDELPIDDLFWVEGLRIDTLAFKSNRPLSGVSWRLPDRLRTLVSCGVGLLDLDLSNVPWLLSLYCTGNRLTKLDLAGVPRLKVLDCEDNALTDLDLSGVPELRELNCSYNRMTALNLSSLPRLTKLDCEGNALTVLELSGVPRVTDLFCAKNNFTKLDCSSVPGLKRLDCRENELSKLDLSGLSRLELLDCWDNHLIHLDLSDTGGLKELGCGANQLTELDLSGVPDLTILLCSRNELDELDIRPVRRVTQLN